MPLVVKAKIRSTLNATAGKLRELNKIFEHFVIDVWGMHWAVKASNIAEQLLL